MPRLFKPEQRNLLKLFLFSLQQTQEPDFPWAW